MNFSNNIIRAGGGGVQIFRNIWTRENKKGGSKFVLIVHNRFELLQPIICVGSRRRNERRGLKEEGLKG